MSSNRDRVPVSMKLAWSSGVIAHTFMANIFSYLAFPIYNIGLGVPAAWLGWAMGMPRLWDAVTDPVMGHISDNTRGRWGRRRPYILIGGILSGICFALIWMPPVSSGPVACFWYFFIGAFVYYTAYTIFVVPWGALGLELTTDFHERTRVMAWRTFVENGGSLIIGAGWWLSFQFGKMSNGTEIDGVRWVGVLFGGLIIVTAVASAIFCRERTEAQAQSKIAFVPALKHTFTNRHFLRLGVCMILIFLGLFTCNVFSTYISLYYVFGGDKEAQAGLGVYSNGIFQFGGLALTPVVAWIGTRIGKKITLLGGLSMTVVAYASTWFFFTPEMPYLQLLSFLLMAPGLSCTWILTSSMLADICDDDEEKTGLRREGMYGAMFTWIIKAGIAGTLVVSGYMLQVAGYDPEAVMQPMSVITRMRVMFVIVPVVFLTTAVVVMSRYPLTEQMMYEIRDRLEARRQSQEDAAPAGPALTPAN